MNSHALFMMRALSEARKGLGFVSPNPAVGCVIVGADGNELSRGYHRKFGGDHAEVAALKNILSLPEITAIQKYVKTDVSTLRGATIYVTLEPCASEGKTPSCAKTLAALPISKVIYGIQDPNPQTSGKGRKILEAAGIKVQVWDEISAADPQMLALQDEIDEIIEHFIYFQKTGRPFLSIKVATSLDGIIAHTSGESRWITGEESRNHVHYLRATHDAVLVGKNTILVDNPRLNIRHADYIDKSNKVIVLDSKGEILDQLSELKIVQNHSSQDIYIVVSEERVSEEIVGKYPVKVIRTAERNGKIHLPALIEKLPKYGIYSVLIEGGAQTISSFLEEGMAQRFYQYIAPQIIGGKSGVSFSRDFGIADWRERLQLKKPKTLNLGNDFLVTGLLPAGLPIHQ